MPDVVAIPRSIARRNAAVAAVGEWLATLPDVRKLEPHELREYSGRDLSVGWRLKVEFADRHRKIDLLVNGGFPRAAPTIVLVDRPEFLTWPHIEEDGALCLLNGNAEIDYAHPTDVTQVLLASAVDLVDDLRLTGKPEDFRSEFHTYWDRQANLRSSIVYCLQEPTAPTRLIRTWRGQAHDLIGDDEAIKKWIRHRTTKTIDTSTEPALLIWLEQPLVPKEFPKGPANVITLAEKHGAGRLLDQMVMDGGNLVVLAAPTLRGPCLAAVTLTSRTLYGQRSLKIDEPIRGFRPGKVPRSLLVNRFFSGGTAIKQRVQRADPSWVHGRGKDIRFDRLRKATVAILGCGSVGAPIALQLAGAGLGSLILVDPELLTWANVGRHPLGAGAVGHSKAGRLAEAIRAKYPHIVAVESVEERWSKVGAGILQKLANCDLIVSAMGDWLAEGELNEWHRENRARPIVYGWTEAHACAGHAVTILKDGGCLQCGFATNGKPLLEVTEWPGGSTVEQEPACGAVYQPYGPVELGHIVSLIAESAIDCLLGVVERSVCRTWAGRASLLNTAGGSWSKEWIETTGNRTNGEFVHEREWSRNTSCVECGATKA